MHPVVKPNHWQGEANCLIGPFHDHHTAQRFTQEVVDFGHFDAFERRVIAHPDAWYVAVTRAHRYRVKPSARPQAYQEGYS